MSSLPSRLSAVVIYRDGALCTRVASISAGAEPSLRLGGLPLSLEAGSLRAKVLTDGGVRVLDVRPQFDVELAEEINVPEEQRALESAQVAVDQLQVRRNRVDTEIAELENLRPKFLEPKRGELPREAPVEAMLALGDFSDARLAPRLEDRRRLDRQLEDARREVELRHRRLQEASSARRTERARLSRVAVVTLSGPVEAPLEVALEYLVPGARWVPNYALRLERGMTDGTLQLRASVAQATGEDWTGVALALSTASLSRRADLPELRALKIGRRQESPPSSGWRAPPPGLDELFEAYDGALAGLQPARHAPPPASAPRSRSRREERASNAELQRKGAPGRGSSAPVGFAVGGMAPPAPMARAQPVAVGAPPASPMKMRSAEGSSRRDAAPEVAEEASADLAFAMYAGEEEGGGVEEPAAEPTPRLEAGLMDYRSLVMLGMTGPQRGRLQPGSPWDFAFVAGVSVQVDVVMAAVGGAMTRARAVRGLPLPSQCLEVESIQSFDYRYDCITPVDMPSTGKWITVQVMSCDVGLTPEYVCVPSVDPKVYRTLQVANRSPHALLPGPVDVTQGDEFLLTTALPAIPPGADSSHRLGLGVEEAIKVARKTQYKESTGGFLGGSTVMPHDLEVEVNNRLGSPARLEIRERVPYSGPDEKDLKVEDGESNPKWEVVDRPIDGQVVRGARRWRVTVPSGESLKLTAQFVIRMPGDKMLVGGNRRA